MSNYDYRIPSSEDMIKALAKLENQKERDLFLSETNNSKVMTRPIWQLMYRLPMYNNCQRDGQFNAQFLEERIVNIPSSVR